MINLETIKAHSGGTLCSYILPSWSPTLPVKVTAVIFQDVCGYVEMDFPGTAIGSNLHM